MQAGRHTETVPTLCRTVKLPVPTGIRTMIMQPVTHSYTSSPKPGYTYDNHFAVSFAEVRKRNSSIREVTQCRLADLQ
jgi:hypothetical protein